MLKSLPTYAGRYGWYLAVSFLLTVLTTNLCLASERTTWPKLVASKDSSLISYQQHSESGTVDLLLVHGWNCDSRYWQEQIPFLSQRYRVTTLDLAGHGHSGQMREKYTMRSFGEDVQSVVEAIGSDKVILIGHSMGGAVIAEAARLMPDKVIGLIGVDCLEDVEYPLTQQDYEAMMAPFQQNFKTALRDFVMPMLRPETAQPLKEWIINDMAAAPPQVAMSALNEMMKQYIRKDLAANFDHISCPVVTVNADLWPVNEEANRRHMRFYQAIILPQTDHFLMLNQPQKSNRAIQQAIEIILEQQAS